VPPLTSAVLVSLRAEGAGLGTPLGPVSETPVVPEPSAVSVVSRATRRVAAETIVEARAAVPEARPTLPRIVTWLGDQTRYLAGETANRLYDLRIVRTGTDLATVDGEKVSMMRSAQRAAASSPTSGIPARITWTFVGRRLVQRIRR
jgi:hypothetical protein